MEEHGVGYSSTGLIARMRQNGNVWQEGVCSHPSCLLNSLASMSLRIRLP